MNKFDVESILNSVNLRDLVEKAGGQVDNHGRSFCPLHGGSDSTAFSLSNKDGRDLWFCYSGDCGGGDAITFVQKWQGLDFKGACAFLGGDIVSDPIAMEQSAKERLERAKIEHEEARLKVEARRKELQKAELHLHYHQTMKQWAQNEWLKRGLDESWQGLWMLGGCDDKCINYKGEFYHTPSITIPIVNETYDVQQIQHRLINPPNPKDRYRPEKEGLGGFPPFLAFPDIGYKADLFWIIEGAIKSMVTASITPDSGWQFIGVTNQHGFDTLNTDLFKGKKVIVVPDPNAERKAWEFSKKVGGRLLILGDKIDDLIIENDYRGDWLASMKQQSRKV